LYCAAPDLFFVTSRDLFHELLDFNVGDCCAEASFMSMNVDGHQCFATMPFLKGTVLPVPPSRFRWVRGVRRSYTRADYRIAPFAASAAPTGPLHAGPPNAANPIPLM
jgi:hypothetical protein